MALMDIFKKKPKEEPPADIPGMPAMPAEPAPAAPASDVPVSQVVGMQRSGLTNNQIIQTLQRQGFQPTNIYDALTQAEMKKSIEPAAPSAMTVEPPQGLPEGPPQSLPSTPPATPQGVGSESEELVEQIIEEKWRGLQKEFSKSTEWKDAVNSRMDKLEQSMTDFKSDLDGLHKAIVSRVGEYDKTLMDVGTEIKAMEKVFQKVLPELTSNVQELSRITKSTKK